MYIRYTYTVFVRVCANTYSRNVGAKYCTVHTDTVGKSMGTKEMENIYKYANTRVVFELIHVTKFSFNVVLLESNY